MIIIRYKHGAAKSYEIVRKLLGYIYKDKGSLTILDLTFGTGRFYRYSKRMIKKIIAVDITKHDWEVEPTTFYQMDCRIFTTKVMRGEIRLEDDIDVIVIDPPWSAEKRGAPPKETGVSKQPYHVKGIDSTTLIQAALQLHEVLRKPLLYRYKQPLKCNHRIIVMAETKIFRRKGYIYYGICLPP
jgi:hypothetical protein